MDKMYCSVRKVSIRGEKPYNDHMAYQYHRGGKTDPKTFIYKAISKWDKKKIKIK